MAVAEDAVTSVGVISLDLIVKANLKEQLEKMARAANVQAQESFSGLGQAVGNTVEQATKQAKEAMSQPFDVLKQKAAATEESLDAIIARSMQKASAPLRSTREGDALRVVPREKTTLATDPATIAAFEETAEKAKQVKSEVSKTAEKAKQVKSEVSKTTEKTKEVNAEIAKTAEKMKELPAAASNTAKAFGGVSKSIRQANVQLAQTGRMNVGEKIRTSFSSVGSTMKGTMGSALGGIKKGISGVFLSLGSAAKRLGKTIMGSFKAVFLTAALYAAFQGLKALMKQSTAQSAEFSKSLNAVKANLSIAFQPIIQAIMPALITLMSGLAEATKQVAAFISALFGMTYKQSADAAKKLQGVQGKAEKAKGALAGFDELTVVGPQGSGAGEGAGDIDYGELDTSGTEWAESLAQKSKDAFASIKKGVKEAGDYFMEKLGGNQAFGVLKKSGEQFVSDMKISFDNVKAVGTIVFDEINKSVQKNLPNIEAGISGLVVGTANVCSIVTGIIGGVTREATSGIRKFVEENEPEIRGLIDRTITNCTEGFANLGTAYEKITGTVAKGINDFFEKNGVYVSEWSRTASTAFWDLAQPVIDFFSGTWNDITQKVKEFAEDPALEDFLAAVNELLVALQPAWEKLNEVIRYCWDMVGTKLNIELGILRSILNGIWQFIKDRVISIFEEWTGTIRAVTVLLRGDWKISWEEAKKGAVLAIEGIIDTFKKFINIFIDGINTIIRGLNDIEIDLPGGGKFGGFGIPEIPRLANGGVITQPTLGLIGEYPGAGGNPEIVSPRNMMYDTMVEANAPMVVALAEKLDQVIAAVGRISTVVELDGEKISKNTVGHINDETRRTGKTPILV